MEQKIILVTGASSGFGNLIAKTLSKKGHNVYATMRNSKTKNKVEANDISKLNNTKVLDLDVTDEKSVNKCVNDIIKKEGKIDVVVNNAGIGSAGLTESFTIEDTKKIFDVNVLGPLRVNRAVLPQMRKDKSGLIIQISSVIGRMTMPFIGSYVASKWSIEAFAEIYSMELKPYNIDSVIIEPGAYPTDFFNNMGQPSDVDRIKEYGDYAKMPEKMFGGMNEMFSGDDAPNPQAIADAVLKLIEMPQGKRPLRNVVDQITGPVAEELNVQQHTAQEKLNEAFGMV